MPKQHLPSRKILYLRKQNAVVAQLVEHWLPKPRVAGSSPVYRSKQVMVAISMVAISFLGMHHGNPRPIKQGQARVLCKQSGKPITSPVYRSTEKHPQRCFCCISGREHATQLIRKSATVIPLLHPLFHLHMPHFTPEEGCWFNAFETKRSV